MKAQAGDCPLGSALAGFVTVLCAALVLLGGPARAGTETFIIDIDQPFSGSQSPDDARVAALAKGRQEVVDRAGRYVESVTVVRDFVLSRDESLALTAAVLKAEITEQRNYATDQGFGMRVTVRLEVDNSALENRLALMGDDRRLLERYQQVQARERQLLARIRQLEAQNLQLNAARATAQQRQDIDERLKTTLEALSAGDLNRKALALWQGHGYRDPMLALEYLSRAVVLDTGSAAAWNNRGVVYYGQGRLREAMDDFDRALRIEPRFEDALLNRGLARYAQERYAEAIADYDRALQINPANVAVYLNRANANKQIWQYRRMVDDFSRAMALAPDAGADAARSDSVSAGAVEIEYLCNKARLACRHKLCRALNYLNERGFCRR